MMDGWMDGWMEGCCSNSKLKSSILFAVVHLSLPRTSMHSRLSRREGKVGEGLEDGLGVRCFVWWMMCWCGGMNEWGWKWIERIRGR